MSPLSTFSRGRNLTIAKTVAIVDPTSKKLDTDAYNITGTIANNKTRIITSGVSVRPIFKSKLTVCAIIKV